MYLKKWVFWWVVRSLQAAQTGQAAEHSLSQVADGVLSKVQALQQT